MTAETFFGWLIAAAVFFGMAYLLIRVVGEMLTGKGTSRDDAANALRSNPLHALFSTAATLTTVAFFGMIVFGGLIFDGGASEWFLYGAGAMIVFWVLASLTR
jgi:high-affinity Fe2+/Pb2+ permease